jgi:hypothetical protein
MQCGQVYFISSSLITVLRAENIFVGIILIERRFPLFQSGLRLQLGAGNGVGWIWSNDKVTFCSGHRGVPVLYKTRWTSKSREATLLASARFRFGLLLSFRGGSSLSGSGQLTQRQRLNAVSSTRLEAWKRI